MGLRIPQRLMMMDLVLISDQTVVDMGCVCSVCCVIKSYLHAASSKAASSKAQARLLCMLSTWSLTQLILVELVFLMFLHSLGSSRMCTRWSSHALRHVRRPAVEQRQRPAPHVRLRRAHHIVTLLVESWICTMIRIIKTCCCLRRWRYLVCRACWARAAPSCGQVQSGHIQSSFP